MSNWCYRNKCVLASRTQRYVFETTPERTKHIELIPPPKTLTDVRSVLGIANYTSPFVYLEVYL